jgi:spermidine synthase
MTSREGAACAGRFEPTKWRRMTPETIVRGRSKFGDLVLRRRSREDDADPSPVHELISNGVFLMDSEDCSTERKLASESLARVSRPEIVVIGGLGLGFTLLEVAASSLPRAIHLVEIEGLLVDWASQGLIPQAHSALRDPRVRVHIADIRTYVESLACNAVDLILIDVDNGPDFLVHESNAPLYESPFFETALKALRSGGLISVWSSSRSARLQDALAGVFNCCDEVAFDVTRAGRQFEYFLYFGLRP